MGEPTTEDLLEEMAIRASTLVANPNSIQARRAMKLSLAMYLARKRRQALAPIAAEADAESRERTGYRADVDG